LKSIIWSATENYELQLLNEQNLQIKRIKLSANYNLNLNLCRLSTGATCNNRKMPCKRFRPFLGHLILRGRQLLLLTVSSTSTTRRDKKEISSQSDLWIKTIKVISSVLWPSLQILKSLLSLSQITLSLYTAWVPTGVRKKQFATSSNRIRLSHAWYGQ